MKQQSEENIYGMKQDNIQTKATRSSHFSSGQNIWEEVIYVNERADRSVQKSFRAKDSSTKV